MGTINLANSNNRDAVVNTEAVRPPMRVRWLDEKGRQAANIRMLRCTVDRDCEELVKQAGALEKVAELLVKDDPEVNVETYGRYLSETSRVYIDQDTKIVHLVQEWEIIRNVDGSERERRPRKAPLPNVSTEAPLRWSGKMMKKSEVFNKFVFAGKQQIVHVNGLTFDFLYAMAKELEEKQSLMLMGAGPKNNQPLIFQRGGVPYRGFLEGRTQGDKYCLILHLSNMELKAPEFIAKPPEAEAPAAEAKPETKAEVKPAAPTAEAALEKPKASKSTAKEASAEAKPEKKKGGRSKKA